MHICRLPFALWSCGTTFHICSQSWECVVWRAASDISLTSTWVPSSSHFGPQALSCFRPLRYGWATRRLLAPVAPSLSTFHHALTVVVPVWINLVPCVWEVSLDYEDGMPGISSYLPFVWSILELIVFCCNCDGFRLFKSDLLWRHVCFFSSQHSDNAKQTSRLSQTVMWEEVSHITFTYLYHLLKSEPVGDGVIQEDQRAFHTALKNICSKVVGGKAADTWNLLGKHFQHFLFFVTADLLPLYEKIQHNLPVSLILNVFWHLHYKVRKHNGTIALLNECVWMIIKIKKTA